MNCDYCDKPIGEYIAGDIYCSSVCQFHAEYEETLARIGTPPVAQDVGRLPTDAPRCPWNARPFTPQKIHAPAPRLADNLIVIDATPDVGGIKHDSAKTPLELLPLDAIEEVAKVLQFGAKKYTPNNWRCGFVYGRLFGALLRHLFSWWRGEDKDPETGLSPLAHAACNVLFLLHFVLAKTGTDNRKENNA